MQNKGQESWSKQGTLTHHQGDEINLMALCLLFCATSLTMYFIC